MATTPKPRVPFPQYDYPGSKISPFTGKPYTAQQAASVHSKTSAAATKKKADADRQAKLQQAIKSGLPNEFIKESRNRFNTVDSTLANNLAMDVLSGKITREAALEQIRKGTAVKDPDKLRVGLDVSAEIDPQLSAIERRRELAKKNLEFSINNDEATAKRTNTDIQGIYNALMDRLQTLKNSNAQSVDQTTAAINQQYGQTQQTMQDAYARANAATAQQVAGAQGGTTQGQILGGQDAASFANIAAIQQQGHNNVLATQRNGQLSQDTAMLNYAGHIGASEQAEVLQQLQQRAAQLRHEYGAEDYELGGQAIDLEAGRYPALYEGYQSLQEQREQAMLDAEDRAYEREMAERSLGIKEYGAETDRYKVDTQREIENAKIRQDAITQANKHNIEVQRLQIEKDKLTDPLQRQLIQAKIDSENAKATELMAKAQKASQPTGADGKPDRYTQAMSVLQNIPGIRPDQVNYLQGLVDSAAARSDYDKFFITKGNEFMMERLNQGGYNDDATRRYVRQALAILLGVV